MTRFVVDPDAAIGIGIGGGGSSSRIPVIDDKPTATVTQPPSSLPTTTNNDANTKTETPSFSPTPERPKRAPTPVPTLVANKPTSYVKAMQAIYRRRLVWENTDTDDMGGGSDSDSGSDSSKPAASTSTSTNDNAPERPPRGASTDPVRTQLREKIDELREDHEVCMYYYYYYCTCTKLYRTVL